MAIAVDASGTGVPVARATGTVNVATTATFTPPDGCLLVACVNCNTNPTNGATAAVTGGSLTWTQNAEADFDTEGAGSGHSSMWTAPVTVGVSMTVVATIVGGSNRVDCKVYVVTGQHASPIGASGHGRSTTNNINVGYTSTANSSRAFAVGTEWQSLGVPSSTDTADAAAYGSTLSVESVYKAADTATSGTAVTVNLDAAGTGTPEWMWCALEIKPAVAAAVLPILVTTPLRGV